MPVHGCENVVKQTEFVNNNKLLFKKEATGIIDNDFRTDENIKALNKKRVCVLPVNEIENIFLLPLSLETAIKIITCEKSLEDIQDEIIKIISDKLIYIKKDFATKLLRNIQLKNKFSNIDNIEECLSEMFLYNKDKFLELYKEFETKLTDSINNKNYNELMELVPGKMLIESVSKLIGFSNKDIFTKNILKKIHLDSNLKKSLINIIKKDLSK